MRIVVTGGNGFIGKNLRLRLSEEGQTNVVSLTRTSTQAEWEAALSGADIVFHLAGVNRPQDPVDFMCGNFELTARICTLLEAAGNHTTLVLSSSTQAMVDNPYGRSKVAAERAVIDYAERTGARTVVMRLPNVFGKWARPDYNSVVATFCYNLLHDLPITIHDEDAPLRLVYIDDVVDTMLTLLSSRAVSRWLDVMPVYDTTVGEMAAILRAIAANRKTLTVPRVGVGLSRALHATFLSYVEPESFSYRIAQHVDARGSFSEFLRTVDSGQISIFTAHPGVTRGEHYHHTKTEKFLVVHGKARFAFRHVITGEIRSIEVSADSLEVVETVPGWAHSVTNISADEMIVLLWASEIFDSARPDTIPSKVQGT
jgi:UDP-2-acetamido-2,6-beta-L-arabino-hexul-4-ose reductase